MKILIDGAVLSQIQDQKAIDFWKEIIPRLTLRLRGNSIYYLNRNSSSDFPDITTIDNLYAPLVDYSLSALEDRRLASLCRNLGIDVFITTYYTSAGSEVKTLSIDVESSLDFNNSDDLNIISSKQRSLRFTSFYLAVYQEKIEEIQKYVNLPSDNIQFIYADSHHELDWITVANFVSKAIINLNEYKISQDIARIQLSEEEATQAEALGLRKQVYGEESANNYFQSETYKIEQNIRIDLANKAGIPVSRQLLQPSSYSQNQNYTQTLSVCMMVQNSEKTLDLALSSLNNIYNELIIVDGGSTDKTIEIASKYGAKIINSSWSGNHSRQRNVYLKEVRTDWVFVLDSDEFIDKKTWNFLEYLKVEGSKVPTDNFWIARKWISHFNKKLYISSPPHYPDWQRRIFKYNQAVSYSGQIHENIHGLEDKGQALPELCVYHLDLLINSESQREQKVNRYTKAESSSGMHHYYIPDLNQLSLRKWNHQELLPETQNLLNLIPVKCKVCESDSHHFSTAKLLGKYDVDYFQCSNCGFVQTEHPYWLDEAYSEAIAISDVGLVYRNNMMANITGKLLFNYFDHKAKFLDYGGGYGLFTRLMRDQGFNFYWFDKFCQNIFARGFELQETDKQNLEIITAFELFEHLTNPLQELKEILDLCPNILFSTELLPEDNPTPDKWWYYTPHEGQHISIYTLKSLEILASKYNLQLYTDGKSLHLLTKNQDLPQNLFQELAKSELPSSSKESLLSRDFNQVVSNLLLNNRISNVTESVNFPDPKQPIIIIDGVFFQLYKTGIARVWQSLLEQWVNTGFADHIVVLDRDNTPPKINGIRYRTIPRYDYNNTEADKEMLQQICNEEEAGLFISTYYTTPIETPSVFMAYDMIPELLGGDLNEPMWREKHHAIKHASAYISISENTAKDLNKCFPDIPSESITVAHCGVDPLFHPASESEINAFKYKYGVTKPYFLLVGSGSGYKNGILFFQAFAKLASSYGFDIICTGIGGVLTPELRTYTSGSAVHLVQLSDEELALAYSGAVALVYPSKYEGFGMPLLEAMACGCPVITCPNASIPEVTGEAAIYVNDDDVAALANAMCEVQKPSVRHSLITAGLAQSKNFSWTKMAEIVSSELINTTLLPLNLREINLIIFPDWSQPEDELGLELQEVIQTLATHPNSEKITLLINTGDIDTEDAEIFLSSVVMNLLMEDLDITDTINISLVDKLGDTQWQPLLTRIYGRITLNNEDKVALAQATVSKIHSYQIDSLISQF
ncbi:MAG: glycosyltransferase [Dolichospermum sp. DEX189]|jgi:glycosyltransferase involved in cell wall biosynthesis|nr:glycosyltransferase [Dolichospermum sp. DEX189]